MSIIANPRSGRGRAFRRVQEYVRNWPHRDWEVEVLTTRAPGHAAELARALVSRPPDLLAVCGGDGTVNEVANGMPDPPFPVAVLPAGTANVLARSVGVPLDPVEAIKVALGGSVLRVDSCFLQGMPARYFLLMAGAGFDAYVVSRTSSALKDRVGIAAFYQSTVQCLATYDFPEFAIEAEGLSVRATTCVVANSRGYGGGLVLTPSADMTDGLLDIVAVQGRSRVNLALFALTALRGKPRRYPWVRYARARSVDIDGPSEVMVQVDGEQIGNLPAAIRIVPRSFPLVVPAHTSR
jgi:YegS/Rv2252/BmrU family lipid kinase